MSDVATNRMPRGPREALAGFTQLRVWGLGVGAAATAAEIAGAAARAGFVDVDTELAGERVIAPALRAVRRRLGSGEANAPRMMRLASRIMLAQIELLWERGVVDYLFLRAAKPAS